MIESRLAGLVSIFNNCPLSHGPARDRTFPFLKSSNLSLFRPILIGLILGIVALLTFTQLIYADQLSKNRPPKYRSTQVV